MSNRRSLVIIKGEVKNNVSDYDDSSLYTVDVYFENGKKYTYKKDNVQILTDPVKVDPDDLKFVTAAGKELNHIQHAECYSGNFVRYYKFYFLGGRSEVYSSKELKIYENAASTPAARNLLDYYKLISKKIGLHANDGANILYNQLNKISFVDKNTVLARYIEPQKIYVKSPKDTVIFPFGCNSSQMTAVSNAVANKISIIEGPPGTGKTQTILNIIANALINGKNVAVVSNNNSATDNVFEKLQKYGFDYIAAQLGNSSNKADFIENKQSDYPDFSKDILSKDEMKALSNEIFSLEADLKKLLEYENLIAQHKRELSELQTEKTYFDNYYSSTYDSDVVKVYKKHFNSSTAIEMWAELEDMQKKDRHIGFFFKLRLVLHYLILNFSLFKRDINDIIPVLQKLYYEYKEEELTKEIHKLEKSLVGCHFDDKQKELSGKSVALLKAALAKRYSENGKRRKFTTDDLWRSPKDVLNEYPIILSTTHSVRSSLKDIVYDYVIVDESSQVDLATGVLAMSSSKNIVIVGDLKQLPNIITEETRKKITAISDSSAIEEKYRYEDNSLLSSVIKVIPDAPRTLLREHYRCRPKIIDFCNKKFYNDQLIIMTEDNGEKDVLRAYVTVKGNHARGRYNQRQIDEIKNTIIPELNSDDLGIIAPYNAQTSALTKDLANDMDISTVHKFQGREKNDIIISTVDNEITAFTDDPNMLNVAVSRAKNRLRLVVSENESNEKTNIGDLLKYIRYNNFEVINSEVYSVFDMLYKGYEHKKKEYLSYKNKKKISEYDSENLMYSVIEDVLSQDRFSKLDVVAHQPLCALIYDPHRLTDDECRYAMNFATHIDFLIFGRLDKMPVLAIEVDGYAFHGKNSDQHKRDMMKNAILQKYAIPIMRFSTTGSGEKERLETELDRILFDVKS